MDKTDSKDQENANTEPDKKVDKFNIDSKLSIIKKELDGFYLSYNLESDKMDIFKIGCSTRNYAVGNHMANNALNLPIHDALTLDQIREVCDLIKLFFAKEAK